jgi:hypothetical protein
MLKQDSLAGGAARSVFHRRKKDQTQPGDLKMQNDVTRNLISTLKGCLNQGMSQQILKAAEAWVEKPSKLKQKPKPKRAKGRTKTPHSRDDPDIGYWKDQNGQWRPYRLDKNGWWYWCDAQIPDQHRYPSWKGYAQVASHETVVRVDTWISSLRPQDWSNCITPQMISFGKIKNALRSGEKIPGTVVEVWSEAQITELQSLWTTYENPTPLTALLCGEAMQVSDARLRRLTLLKCCSTADWQSAGALDPSATSVAKDKVPQVTRVTIRVTAPEDFRTRFLHSDSLQDSPVDVIRDLAWLSDASVNEFLGAKWNQHTHQNITQLEAYFRVKQIHADKLKQSSGSRGLFISVVESGPRTRKPPFWIPRNADECSDAYLQRALLIAKERKQNLFHRLGKGNTLGFDRQENDVDQHKSRLYVVFGIPRPWSKDDVEIFLGGNGWTQLEGTNRKGKQWFVRAFSPKDSSQSSHWRYDVESGENPPWSIDVHLAVRAGRNPNVVQTLKGPKKIKPEKFQSQEGSESLTHKVETSTGDRPPARPVLPKESAGEIQNSPNKSRSPRRQSSTVALTQIDSEASPKMQVDDENKKKVSVTPMIWLLSLIILLKRLSFVSPWIPRKRLNISIGR